MLYIFSKQDASDTDLIAFINNVKSAGLDLQFMTVNINGVGSLMVLGKKGLRDEASINLEYRLSCGLGVGPNIYLSRVMRNDGQGETTMNTRSKAGALAALAVAASGSSPATASLAPPVIIAPSQQQRVGTTEFEVLVSASAEQLWVGSLRVADSGVSTFEQSLNQAYEPCSGRTEEEGRRAANNRRLSVRLGRTNWREDSDQFSVNTNWQRPYSACEGGGTSTVQFERIVKIAPGETVTLKGDAGLMIRLRRLP
jgi:hypothetical protein